MPTHLPAHARPPRSCSLLAVLVLFSLLRSAAAQESWPGRTFDVVQFGAVGDGIALNTEAIQRAIDACAEAGGGQVRIPAGTFLSGTLHLRSRVSLYLAAGATLAGTTNLNEYRQPQVPAFMPEAKWGKWHRALILAENVVDAALEGPGRLDGREVFDPTGEERMRGPHTVVLVNCRRVAMRDLSIVDSANYAVFFQVSDQLEFRNLKIVGGWDAIHFRGAPERWCSDVKIVDCQFYTGDDAIAGRYWDNVIITGCVINSSCNGIRLIGPATRLIISHCLFYGPGEAPHRTSARTNMLSGIILQPGAWDKTEGLLDEVLISQNTMRDVASPVTLWTKPGNPVGRVVIAGLQATGVYRSALSVESWAETPMTNVVVRNVSVEFLGGGQADLAAPPVRGPGVDARPLPAWGLYARNVRQLTLEDVRFSAVHPDLRPVIFAEKVERLTLDQFRAHPTEGVDRPIVLDATSTLEIRNSSLPR